MSQKRLTPLTLAHLTTINLYRRWTSRVKHQTSSKHVQSYSPDVIAIKQKRNPNNKIVEWPLYLPARKQRGNTSVHNSSQNFIRRRRCRAILWRHSTEPFNQNSHQATTSWRTAVTTSHKKHQRVHHCPRHCQSLPCHSPCTCNYYYISDF